MSGGVDECELRGLQRAPSRIQCGFLELIGRLPKQLVSQALFNLLVILLTHSLFHRRLFLFPVRDVIGHVMGRAGYPMLFVLQTAHCRVGPVL